MGATGQWIARSILVAGCVLTLWATFSHLPVLVIAGCLIVAMVTIHFQRGTSAAMEWYSRWYEERIIGTARQLGRRIDL
jgi:hypothetical protein